MREMDVLEAGEGDYVAQIVRVESCRVTVHGKGKGMTVPNHVWVRYWDGEAGVLKEGSVRVKGSLHRRVTVEGKRVSPDRGKFGLIHEGDLSCVYTDRQAAELIPAAVRVKFSELLEDDLFDRTSMVLVEERRVVESWSASLPSGCGRATGKIYYAGSRPSADEPEGFACGGAGAMSAMLKSKLDLELEELAGVTDDVPPEPTVVEAAKLVAAVVMGREPREKREVRERDEEKRKPRERFDRSKRSEVY